MKNVDYGSGGYFSDCFGYGNSQGDGKGNGNGKGDGFGKDYSAGVG